MFNKKKIEQLENRVHYLESIIAALGLLAKRYVNEHKVRDFDFFSIASPIEDFYSCINDIDKRIKELEKNKDKTVDK